MYEKESFTKDNSSQEEPLQKFSALDDSEAKGSNAGELRGAIPPSESAEVPLETHEEQGSTERRTPRGVKRWGPWRRWSWYRETRHQARDDSLFFRNRDPKENELGRLPDGEGVQVPALWVTELYTPSTVGGLLKGIRDLGWEYGRNRDDSLTKWMNDVREGRKAGWQNLGLVSPPDDVHFMRERTAPLPPKVKAALPSLMSLTPSLTAFMVVFLFDDEAAASLEVPLRAEFTTITRKDALFRPWHVFRYVLIGGSIRLGHRIYSPDLIRREQVRSQFQKLENDCLQWVRDNLPGAFASLPGRRAPTAVLLVTEKVRPLSTDAVKIRAFEGLALNRDFDAWESDEWPGARLVLPRSWDDEGNRLVFGCRRHDAFPVERGYPEPTSNWTIAQRGDYLIRGLLSRWSITCLLDGYHEALSALRDRTAQDGRYRPVLDLKELRSLARTTLYDVGACSQEIVEFAESDSEYRYDVLEMTYVRTVHGEKLDLLTELMSSQSRRAQQVQGEADLLQSTLSTISGLSQTISNIWIQWFLVFLTLISIGIAFGAAFLTFRTVP